MRILLSVLFLFPLTEVWPKRIVTATPALTEIVQALGHEQQLVGVSRFCPLDRPKVGTSLNLDLEKILTLKADIIFLSERSKNMLKKKVAKLGLNAKWYALNDYQDILHAIAEIGQELNSLPQALKVTKEIESSFPGHPLKRKNVLIVAESSLSSGTLISAHVASDKTFYNDILARLGMNNAAAGKQSPYPVIDREFIIKSQVDKVVLLFAKSTPGKKIMAINKAWKEAVNKKATTVHLIKEDYAVIPGPRIKTFVKKLTPLLQ